MEARRDTHYRECEDNGERRISGSGKHTHLRVLTIQIKQVRTIQALLCTYKTHESHLKDIHLSASWMSLGQLARQSTKRGWLQDSSEAMGSLVKHTMQAARTGDIGAREIANIAYGAARSSEGKQMGVLFVALASAAAEWRMTDFNSQNLANTAWAFATAGH